MPEARRAMLKSWAAFKARKGGLSETKMEHESGSLSSPALIYADRLISRKTRGQPACFRKPATPETSPNLHKNAQRDPPARQPLKIPITDRADCPYAPANLFFQPSAAVVHRTARPSRPLHRPTPPPPNPKSPSPATGHSPSQKNRKNRLHPLNHLQRFPQNPRLPPCYQGGRRS